MKLTDDVAARFDSLESLLVAHAELLKTVPEEFDPACTNRVEEFCRRAAATGCVLDAPDDRRQAQGLIDYWLASLQSQRDYASARRQAKLSYSLLAPFDPSTVQAAVAAADQWLTELPDDNARLTAKKVLLRLARLTPDGRAFEPEPTTRAALYDVDPSSALVDEAIGGLAAAGVLRIARGASPEADQVKLRTAELLSVWPKYAAWLAERRRFRERVEQWEKNGRPSQPLLVGEPLEEIRGYHDRNGLERMFIEKSRYRELWNADRNRVLKVVFAILALLGLAFVLVTGAVGYWAYSVSEQQSAATKSKLDNEEARANIEKVRADIEEKRRKDAEKAEMLEKIRREAVKTKATSDGASMLALALLLLKSDSQNAEITAHVASKVLLIQMLGQVLFSEDPEEHQETLKNWQRLRDQLQYQKEFFPGFLKKHAENIVEITKAPPATEAEESRMLAISDEIRGAIKSPRYLDPLKAMKHLWYSQVTEAAGKLATAAKKDRHFEEVRVFRSVFRRLYCCELVLVEDSGVEGAMVRFGRELRKWEQAVDGKAPPGVGENLERLAAELDTQCAKDLLKDPNSKKGVKR